MAVASPTTSASLLDQARGHSAAAWNRLVVLYAPLLDVWFTRQGLQPADREDLTQRVLQILVKQLPGFEHNGRPGAFRAWLRAIAMNLLREFERSRRQLPLGTSPDEIDDSDADLSRRWEEQHDQHVLHTLMEMVRPEFTDATWRAFQRQALDGAAARVVAEELGLSVNAVLIAKSRVLSRLRQEAHGLVE